MGNCCNRSTKVQTHPKSCGQNEEQSLQPNSPAKSDRYLKWWAIGILPLVLGVLWLFDGNPFVSQIITPLILMGLVLIWFVKLIAQRMGVGRQ